MPPSAETLTSRPDVPVAAASPAGRRIVIGLLLALAAGFPLLHLWQGGLNYWLHMLLFIYMNIAVASSWNIIGGYAGYVSLGHNVFLAVGGYFSGILFAYYGLSPFLTTPLAGLAAMAVGFVVGTITLRTRGPTFIISTIALVLLTKIALDNWDYIGGANGMSLPLVAAAGRGGQAAVLLRHAADRARRGLSVVPHPPLEVRPRPARDRAGRDQGRGRRHPDRPLQDPGVRALRPVRRHGGRALGLLPDLPAADDLPQHPDRRQDRADGDPGRPRHGRRPGRRCRSLFIAANEFFVARFGASELNIAATGLLLILALLFFPDGIVGTLKQQGPAAQGARLGLRDRGCLRVVARRPLRWSRAGGGCPWRMLFDPRAATVQRRRRGGGRRTATQLGAGDRLQVTVFRHEGLSGEFALDGTGTLALPLVGQIAADALTTRELESTIERQLREQSYLVDPHVSIEVLTYRPIYVLGEVAQPGQYEYVAGMTLVTAVALAGGYTYRADREDVIISRGHCMREADAATAVLPGEVVRVPERFF